MKRLFLSILLCAFAWGMKAQEMDAVFVAMPDQYVPQLENAWRKDLIDLYKSGKEAKLKNTMNGFSTLKKLTDDYLLLETVGGCRPVHSGSGRMVCQRRCRQEPYRLYRSDRPPGHGPTEIFAQSRRPDVDGRIHDSPLPDESRTPAGGTFPEGRTEGLHLGKVAFQVKRSRLSPHFPDRLPAIPLS